MSRPARYRIHTPPSGHEVRFTMTTRATVQPVGRRRRYTELPDPPKKLDMLHDKHAIEIKSILVARYEHRPDVLVAGEGYLCRHTRDIRDPQGHLVPDCVIAFGVDGAAIVQSNGYTISEVGKPPDWVLEVASISTARRDYRYKPRVYEAFGIPEYWLFDHTGGRFYRKPLTGYLLVDGKYTETEVLDLPNGEIRGYSPALGLYLCWIEGNLRFYDPAEREYLREHYESETQRIAAEARADAAEARADAVETALAVARSELSEMRARAESEAAERLRLQDLLRRLKEQ